MTMYTHAFFDLDGTIYLDGVLIDGICESLWALNATGTHIFYLTNNTSTRLSNYHKKIANLGLPLAKNAVLSPVVPLTRWMRNIPVERFFAVGTHEFVEDVLSLTEARVDEESPEVVIVAFDRELSYQKLTTAVKLINKGTPWVITNIDKACPTSNGPIPDCGAIADLIYSTTGIEYQRHFGKPGQDMADQVIELSEGSSQILIAGDRLYTDIEIGLLLGAKTILVGTGEFDMHDSGNLSGDFEVHASLTHYLNSVPFCSTPS